MREIAAQAGVAVGAPYYYFKRKEEIVHEYYLRLESDAVQHSDSLCKKTKSFTKRLQETISFKLEQLSSDRSLAKVLAKIAADPDNELSPFSSTTREIRHRTIEMLNSLAEGSDVRCAKKILQELPKLMWLLLMGVIFFWIHDRSKEQRNTRRLVELSTQLLDKVLWLSSLPLTGSVNTIAVKLVQVIFDSFEAAQTTSKEDENPSGRRNKRE
jgi:AcrR family transcriptional regulator